MLNKLKVGIVSILTLGVCALFTKSVSAALPEFYAQDIEAKSKELTNSDDFELDGKTYSIKNYASTVNTTYAKLFSGAQKYYNSISNLYGKNYYLQVFDAADKESIVGDDPITSIIPKECFLKTGDSYYVGKEYGYFVRTKRVYNSYKRYLSSTGLSYYSKPGFSSDVIVLI